jgi:thiosulfate/3-mercaptopyruvate sulfurtransferase
MPTHSTESFPVTLTPEVLSTFSAEEDRVVVDCRFSLQDPALGYQQYCQGHIPGAYYLDLHQDLASPVQAHGGRHPLPDIPTLATKLTHMGVTVQTLVVAYDDSRLAFASRLWWLLKYMGHPRIAVLDGGFSAYQAAGFPLSTEIPSPRVGAFTPQLQHHLVVDIQTVQQQQSNPKTCIIDAREGERYRGEREPIDPVAGHIPGAVNYPWLQVTDAEGKLRSPQALKDYWADVAAAEQIISYCGSGVTACVNLLALEAAGITTGKLYVGSWSDWCSYPLDEQGQALINRV